MGKTMPLSIVFNMTSRWLSSTMTAPSVPTNSIQVAGDMAAHERAHRPADRPIADRFSDVGELGIEPLRVADGELELAFARRSDELVGFGKRKRKRFFEEYVLARGEAVVRHRVVRCLRSGRNVQRLD